MNRGKITVYVGQLSCDLHVLLLPLGGVGGSAGVATLL